MKIIFLDFDGVLNSRETIKNGVHLSNTHCLLLKKLVETTGAEIVISSTWRCGQLVNCLEFMLWKCGGPYSAVRGATPRIEDDRFPGHRGREVQQWLDTHAQYVEKYVILDDEVQFLVSQLPFFIKTDMKVGITEDDVEKAIAILNGN